MTNKDRGFTVVSQKAQGEKKTVHRSTYTHIDKHAHTYTWLASVWTQAHFEPQNVK